MAQERIDNRYIPARGAGNLMYGNGDMGMDMQNNNMSNNNMSNNNMQQDNSAMSNTPAGEGNRVRQNNVQREEDGSVNVFGFTAPPPINFDTEEMRGSIQYILSKNVGEYVVIEFLIGTTMIMRKQGILYYVGTSYVTLYDNQENNFIVCDIFSVKFVYFFFPGDRPDFNFNILREENGAMQIGPIVQNGNSTPGAVNTAMNNNAMRRQQNMRR